MAAATYDTVHPAKFRFLKNVDNGVQGTMKGGGHHTVLLLFSSVHNKLRGDSTAEQYSRQNPAVNPGLSSPLLGREV